MIVHAAWERAGRAVVPLATVSASLGIAFLALRISPAGTALVSAAASVGVAILRRPWLAGLLLVASVPMQQVGALANGMLTATRACLLLAIAATALWLTIAAHPVVMHRGLVLFGLFLIVLVASAHVATDVGAAAAEIARWAIAAVAFACLLQFFGAGDVPRALWLCGTIVGATALEAAYGLALSFRAAGPESFLIGGGITRAFGTFGRPNTFAGFLEFGPFLGLAIGLWFANRTLNGLARYRAMRLQGFAASAALRRDVAAHALAAAFFLAGSAVATLGIVASFSRGAWLGLAAGAFAFACLYSPKSRLATIVGIPILGVVLLSGILGLLPGSLGQRFTSIVAVARPFDAAAVTVTDENFAAVERMAHWQAGWRMFEDHPALGVGVGNFNARYPDYYVREEFRFSQGHAHNFYIHMLAENGLLGLIAYMVLIGFFAALALRVVIAAPHGLARALALGSFATVTSLGAHNIFENLHVLNLSIMFAAVWCLIIAAHHQWRRSGGCRSVAMISNVEYSRA